MAIRVVLADDEPLIIKGLRKLIAWEQLGMTIVARAYDGRELMDVIERYEPDIVISDISMPHLTGIDMIRMLNKRESPIKVIFISAYQEFSYAKDAVAYGAVDYLVKPIVKDELLEALDKAVSLIDQQDEEVRRRDKLQLLERRNRDEEIREWFVRLTDGTLSAESEAYRILESEFAGPRYSVGIIEVDRLDDSSQRWQEQKLIDFAIENIVNELVAASGQGYIFYKNNKLAYVVGHAESDAAARLAEEIREKIEAYLKLNVSIGLGCPVPRLSELARSCLEAGLALQMKYFLGFNRVVLYEERARKASDEHELYTMQSEVVNSLIAYSWDAAREAMMKLLDSIGMTAFGNPPLAVSACFSSMYAIIQEVKNSGVQLAEGGFDIYDLQARLDRFDTFPDMRAGLLAILEELHHRIDDRAGNKEKLLMARIKHYIDEHYNEEITLDSVASIAFMNPYYFSSFFKKHMKQNYKQYVTEVRMKHAIRLLTTTDMMVYEIAEHVGYNNARHFSDMFKKLYGKLPQEYKQSLKS